jgi:hypothetical protein
MHSWLRKPHSLLRTIPIVLLAGAAVEAQEVGIFFDDNGQMCVTTIENFGAPVQARIFAFAEAGTLLNGALLRLEMPIGFRIQNVELPKGKNDMVGDLNSSDGLDVTLSECPEVTGPVLLLEFELVHEDPFGELMVPDVLLELKGGTNVADSLTLEQPQLKLCDPDDPLGGEFELVEAQSQRTTLNCTGECPCTTAVVRRSWTHVKSHYRKP